MKAIGSLLLAAFFLCSASVVFAQPPRIISYQGLIASNGKPISDGVHTVTIAFYDSLSGGAALYNETQTTRTINGVYSIVIGSVTPIAPSLDFRKQYFLGMTIDGGSELSPRTQLTSVPYSLNSASADLAKDVSPDAKGIVTSINEVSGTLRIVGDSTVSVTQSGQTISLHSFVVGSGGSGGIQSLQSPQKTILLTYPNGPLASLDVRDSSISSQKIADGAVTMSKLNSSNASSGQVIKWNGSAWAPANEGGGSSGVQWLLSGNAGTTAGTNYIGTNDNQALDFRTNGSIVLRLNTNNSIQRDAVANVRGARAIDMQLTRSSTLQVASGDGSVISGGDYNTSSGTNSVVGGGVTNTASNSYTTVAGGGNNSATDAFATVSGGGHNTASGSYSSIGGGESNNTSGSSSTIAGGVSDTAAGYVASVGGGIYNYARGTGSVIGGGNSNNVDSGYYGVIGGGWANDIKKNNDVSTIAGGAFNTINATSSSIGGGNNNYIGGDASVIPGGAYLRITGASSFGFNAGTGSADSAFITTSKTAYFGNVDLWIGSTDSTTHQLRLYQAQNGAVSFPGANTKYTAFKAGTQSSNITYTMPTAAPSANGSLLLGSTTGQWSWSNNVSWDATNSRLGFNTTSPNTTVDVSGDLALREHPIALANGNNNNVNIGAFSFIQITGPNAAFVITGISGGTSGKIIVLYNSTGQQMTITNNDNNSAAGSRIFTGNANPYTTPNGYLFDVVTLIYSASKNGWILTGHN